MTLLFITYLAVTLFLSLYGLFQTLMLFLYFRQRKKNRLSGREEQPSRESGDSPGALRAGEAMSLPMVTVQLPVFNERYVVRRVIEAVVNLDYPRDRLQIQVLDDSTDDSADIGREAVEEHRLRGVNIEFIHRDNRKGFKAGALAEGLGRAEGELIAIFDADFVPKPDFLQNLIVARRVFDDPRVGFVQTRWSFINRHESWLTCTQSVMHDMHFFTDQPTRNGNGLWFNFNGSGGVWRRTCIEDAGGWSADTLAEDLDLSYRAEFRGWRGVYFLLEESPNELPTTMTAFKRQQTRWARGSIQCARKLIPRAIMTPSSLLQKISSVMHMANYSMHLWLVMFILLYPVVLYFMWRGMLRLPLWLSLLSPLCLSYVATLIVPQTLHARHTGCKLRYVGLAMCVGVGVSVSNAIAVLKGLFISRSGVFERTPKESAENGIRNIPGARDSSITHEYRLKPAWTLWAELSMAAYCLMAFVMLFPLVNIWVGPMLFYAVCYFTIGFTQIAQWRTTGERLPIPVKAET